MPWVGLELTIVASERAKTVHALDSSATVTGDIAEPIPQISPMLIEGLTPES
jgi:hypothetical protein